MNVTQFKAVVAGLPDSDNTAPVIETPDGNLRGVKGVRCEDGAVVISASIVLVHRDGLRRFGVKAPAEEAER